MPSKQDLLNFRNFEIEFFIQNKFKRYICKKCRKGFWSLIPRETCGDSPCNNYEFIGDPFISKKYDWKKMREKYIKFFQEHGHTSVSRYSTVCRWKPDTFYTGASIYCFLPWVLNKTIEAPANPLVMSQPSVRFGDIENVGLGTGRHMSVFEMLAHHAFNYPREIYWKDRTVELCFEWLTEELGINPELIIFKENLWEGGGWAGPCFEVIVKGNELATLVFMEYEIKNGNYVPIDVKTVDTGYGLERHVWGSQGTPTIYDCTYPELINWLTKKLDIKQDKKVFSEFCKICGVLNVEEVNVDIIRQKIIDETSKRMKLSSEDILKLVLPFHNIYQIADHTKAIMFILNDGVVPSNIQEGYLARLLIRRCARSLEDLGLTIPLSEIVSRQIETHKDVYPEFRYNKEDILKMVEVEQEKYNQTLKRGETLVRKIVVDLEKEKRFDIDDKTLMMLYDSHGLLPRDVKTFAPGMKIDLSDIETKISVQKSFVKLPEEKFLIDIKRVPETKKLYYEDEKVYDFKAKILKVEKDYIILDQTAFYPRGGGQEPDFGTINNCKVYNVEFVGNIIVHFVENPKFRIGETVNCKIDKERRIQIVKHHTATHIINGIARRVLGNHVWQAGSKKDFDKAHLDVTHYEALTDEQVEKIEKLANQIVKRNLKVKKLKMKRNGAERKYGFRIYQGGAVPGKELRIVATDIDVEACGGLHCDSTGEVGEIVILKTERPQDGTIRFIYASDKAAEKYLKEREKIFEECKSLLEVSEKELPEATKQLFEDWKERKKEFENLQYKIARQKIGELKFEKFKDLRFLIKDISANLEQLKEISRELSEADAVILLFGISDKIYVFASAGKFAVRKNIDVGSTVKKVCEELGGSGGGYPNLAQGFGVDKWKLKDIINKVKKELMR